MNPIVYAVPVFMATILCEAWLARRRSQKARDGDAYSLPDALTSLHFGVVSQIMLAFTWLFTFGFYLIAFEHLRIITLPRNELWVWLLALVVYDFCYYWAHRFGHEINLLWAAHQVHHSSEYFNLTTALRQTATGAFTAWPFYVLMAVMGIPPYVFAIVALIDLLYQYWVHTELVPKLGVLERILVTPSNHRVHHGQNDYCIDRNYGGIFIVWDRLFGTFAEERDDEKIVFGIRSPLASYNPLWGNLKGYRDIWRAATSQGSWRSFWRVWLGPPDQISSYPKHGFSIKEFRHFDAGTSMASSHYALLQYALLIGPATHFIAIGSQLPILDRAGYAAFLLIWVISIGRVLEERPHAGAVEALRMVLSISAFVALPAWFGWSASVDIKALAAVYAAASLWLLARRNTSVDGQSPDRDRT